MMVCLRTQILLANGVVSVDEDSRAFYADRALHLAEAYPSEAHAMLAAASAHYAKKAGLLTLTLKRLALSMIESYQQRESPMKRLSPCWLASIGGDEAARAVRAEMEVGASGAYAAWLRRIATPEV
jgi:hypothetical protein